MSGNRARLSYTLTPYVYRNPGFLPRNSSLFTGNLRQIVHSPTCDSGIPFGCGAPQPRKPPRKSRRPLQTRILRVSDCLPGAPPAASACGLLGHSCSAAPSGRHLGSAIVAPPSEAAPSLSISQSPSTRASRHGKIIVILRSAFCDEGSQRTNHRNPLQNCRTETKEWKNAETNRL